MAKKTIKLSTGTIYQKQENGTYYFRYQVNGQRKAVSLKTKNKKEALKQAEELIGVVEAKSEDVVAAHVKHAKEWAKKEERLELTVAWEIYDKHPEKANPATINIYQRYQSYFKDFVQWALHHKFHFLDQINDTAVLKYVEHLKSRKISVDTHNKRIKRVGHVFKTLVDYRRSTTSDWSNPNFLRRSREEIGQTARRLPFTHEQEENIFRVLNDPTKKTKYKDELKVLFYIGAFTGQRLKDCILLQWSRIHFKHNHIKFIQFKTGKEVSVPIAPKLKEQLLKAQEWQNNAYVLPDMAERYQTKDKNGKDVGGPLVNNDILRVIRWSGLEPSVKITGRARAVSVYGFHSLRHSFVSYCLEHNISKAVVVSILGSDSDIIDQYYTHVGAAAQEQAIQAIAGTGKTLQQRHEEALNYLKSIEAKSPELQKLDAILNGNSSQ